MNLLINIASRRRPRQLDELLYNINTTISGKLPYHILIKIDADDRSYQLPVNHNRTVLRPDPISKIYATNYGVSKREWDVVLNVSDDMRFLKPNWDLKIVELIRSIWPEGTDFYPALNDGFIRHKLASLDIKGREYYDRDGYIYHESYSSVSCDAENLFVAMMRGRHHYFPEVLFKHLHPANTKMGRVDDTYHNNSKFDKPDTDNYFKRMADNFYVEGDLKAAMARLDEYDKPVKLNR